MRRTRKVARVQRIGFVKPGRPPEPPQPATAERTPRGIKGLELLSPRLRRLQQRIGYRRTRRIQKMLDRGIKGTVPELLVYDWLEANDQRFRFQSSMMGGIFQRGGAKVDFLVEVPQGIYVWRVQGGYWHNRPENRQRDQIQKIRLEHQKIGGKPVLQVVDLWEQDILERFPEVLRQALLGIEIGL